MHTPSSPRLLGDIGGTNARFAWQVHPGAAPSEVATYPCSEHATLQAAVRHYLAMHGMAMPSACAIAMANPVTGDLVRMTNHHWSFSIAALQDDLGLERLVVINDFTAVALSLPALAPADLHRIGGGRTVAGAALAVLGPGTGLGVSGLMPTASGGWVPIAGEGGHATLAAADVREAAIIDLLRQRYGHASAERALSGPGLVALYEAAATLAGCPHEELSPADVMARARTGSDERCVEALELFGSFLGSVAGNLTLTLGARGGVFIAGGMAPRMLPELARSRFRQRFEGKGRFESYLSAVPTQVIAAPVSPAFVGAAQALDAAN